MFYGVPHTYGIDRALYGVFEEIPSGHGDTNYIACISRRLARQVDTANPIEVRAREIQKEAVCRAYFEQVCTARHRHITQQRLEPKLELLGKERAFGNVIAVLLALEIGGAVQPLQLFAPQGNIRGHKTAAAALEQTANRSGSASASANRTIAVNRHWPGTFLTTVDRSEERRVGKEGRSRATRGGATVKSVAWSIQCS